jgi:hypothetical protein
MVVLFSTIIAVGDVPFEQANAAADGPCSRRVSAFVGIHRRRRQRPEAALA